MMHKQYAGRMFTVFALIVSGLLALLVPAPVRAATVTANAFFDRANGPCATGGTGQCTLREAVIYANAHPGTTVVLLAGTYTLSLSTGTSDPLFGDLNITASMTIVGMGATVTIIDGSAMNPRGRVFSVFDSSYTLPPVTPVVEMSRLTVRGGKVTGYSDAGGGILNDATLTMTDCIVENNETAPPGNPGGGGGIANFESLTLIRTVIRNNVAAGNGGGILTSNGRAVLRSSVVTNNVSQNVVGGGVGGGGIYHGGGAEVFSLDIENTTVSQNRAFFGGGIGAGGGPIRVVNSTISGNTASRDGGGFLVYSGPTRIYLDGVTIASNSSGMYLNISTNSTITRTLLSNTGANCETNIAPDRESYNLSSDRSCAAQLPSPTTKRGIDPQLVSLADNGGATLTHALRDDSPAIDAGGTTANGCPAADQRGVTRPQGAACDIGAYEVQLRPRPDPRIPVVPLLPPMPNPIPPRR